MWQQIPFTNETCPKNLLGEFMKDVFTGNVSHRIQPMENPLLDLKLSWELLSYTAMKANYYDRDM